MEILIANLEAPPLDVQINHLKDGILFKLSKLPTIFIVEIAGRAHGIGSEFIAQCDIRFAARGKAIISQFEVTLGLLPGAGGIPFLLQNIGRGKTLEYALSGLDIDADTAEKIGVVNHAYDPQELRSKVDEYANLIAKFESQALATVKERINAYSRPQESMINVDNADFFRIAAEPRIQELISEFLVLTKNQSDNEYEKDIEKIVPKLYG
jgi:enoyl-CoA hydratase/carnithine racemase